MIGKMLCCNIIFIFFVCIIKVEEIKAQCAKPYKGENKVLLEPDQTYQDGATAMFKCGIGYRPVDIKASRMISCKGSQWTDLELECQKKSCGSPSDLLNGKYLFPNGILFGATITAECNQGYQLTGPKTRYCLDMGWDGRSPVCEAVTCISPPSIENGHVAEELEDFYTYQQMVSYVCDKGFTLIGESISVCSEDGTFQPLPPQCLKVYCNEPHIPHAVRVEGKSPPYGFKSFVRYKCNHGYKMDGTDVLVCNENGWSSQIPKCVVDCVLPDIPNAKRIKGNFPPYEYGDVIEYACESGYSMAGEGFLECKEYGWNTSLPECKKSGLMERIHISWERAMMKTKKIWNEFWSKWH